MLNQSATFTVKKPIDKIKSFFNDKFSISVFLVVLFSNLLGSLLVGSKSAFFFNMADKLFSSFYNLISSGNFFRVFLCSFFILAAFYLFEYFLSNGVFGFIFIYLFAFGIGLLHGLAAGFAYNNFGLQGITINVILIVPFFIFNYLLFIYFGSECFLQSIDFFKIVFNKSFDEAFNHNFKRLSLRLGFTLLLCLVISVLFSSFSILISKFFSIN